jgi:hypothetical protein
MRERTTRVEFLGRGVGRETRVNCVPGSGISRALRRKDLEIAGAMSGEEAMRERTVRVEFLGRGVGRETRVNCVPGAG